MKDFNVDLSEMYREPGPDGTITLYDDVTDTNDIVAAQYAPVKGHMNNPDICALPATPTPKSIFRNNSIPLSGYDRDTASSLPSYEKKEAIHEMVNVSCPLGSHIDIAETIHSLLIGSYGTRVIRLTERVQDTVLDKAGICTDLLSIRDRTKGRAESFAVFGRTGCGKTFGASHAVSKYRKAIHHTLDGREYTQIPILYVTCYVGNLSSLFRSIARELDTILDTREHHRSRVNSASIGKAANIVTFWIQLYHIGLIIIDEVQYLDFGKGNGSFENIVGISEETGVAFGLIGNNDAREKISRLPRIYGRIMNHIIDADDMSHEGNQMFFRAAIRSLWQYQWTDEYRPITPAIEEELVMASSRNIYLLKVILMQMQYEAISRNKEKQVTIDDTYISEVIVPKYKHMRLLLCASGNEAEKEFQEEANRLVKRIKLSAAADRETAKVAAFKEYEKMNRLEGLEERVRTATVTLHNLPDMNFTGSEINRAVAKAFRNDPSLENGTSKDIVNAAYTVLLGIREKKKKRVKRKQDKKGVNTIAEKMILNAVGTVEIGTAQQADSSVETPVTTV